MSGEWPFRLHLYTEQQLRRYIRYCTRAKYSFVHIDATGQVLRKMAEQKRPLIYAAIFKDGDDTNDTIPLAHGLLTDHTAMSINIFLGSVAQSIAQVRGEVIGPSFFVIDFSAAIMNAVLLAFNSQNIQAHLNRCWNVINKKYDTRQLRSLSFIHFCCCHVMHAVAKNLTDARIDKELRERVLYVFALILCETELTKMYEILGSLVSIFGDPSNKRAEQDLKRLVADRLAVDADSVSALTDSERIFTEANQMREELEMVDEYFRSSAAIIHQSPFNREANRLNPSLSKILNPKSSYPNVDNPLFSRKLIRLIYKWWAYLPLWTGLLVNFKERHANDVELKSTPLHSPMRFSNALIESYFRTMKHITLQGKRYSRPDVIIERLLDAIEQQLKAGKFGVTHGAKGRKRKKHDLNEEETWGKKAATGKRRSKYFDLIDKIKSRQSRTTVQNDKMKKTSVKTRFVYLHT